MENKINIAELLKDCPKGMELDCVIHYDITLFEVDDPKNTLFPIRVLRPDGGKIHLTKYGQYADTDFSKCVIFPKGKTTWDGFVPPCKFKDGDVITCSNSDCTFTSIFKDKTTEKSFQQYCFVISGSNIFIEEAKYSDYANPQFATKEEKAKLFKAIKDNGYKWNPETKTLEKLIEPKFKVGDKIKHKVNKTSPFTITEITDTSYKGGYRYEVLIEQQDNFELVPDKFDITTLNPFDKVLVRNDKICVWTCDLYSHYSSSSPYNFICTSNAHQQCIPYNDDTKHLLGTTDDCDEYYKNW